MKHSALTVDQWKELNAHRLVECRWGCSITVEACRSYPVQDRALRAAFQRPTRALSQSQCRLSKLFAARTLPSLGAG